mmetsp:Transcript_109043/g.319163  ORF Transcript_109043/g.319163 Transcript_109043/m.319163 type:complete len:449 (-) Transcript_109043:163-1509(-)
MAAGVRLLRSVHCVPHARSSWQLPLAARAVLLPSPWPFQCRANLRRGLCVVGEGNEMLRHVAEHGAQPFSKYSLEDLFQLQELAPGERHRHLNSVLHVGISKIILSLQGLPLGFGAMAPIRNVIHDYVQDIRDLRSSPPDNPEQFEQCILAIFSRHREMISQIARGLLEFQSELRLEFEPLANLTPTNCAEACETVPAVRRIETVLDEIFTVRTTLRLLIAHCLQLTPEGARHYVGFSSRELQLLRIPEGLRSKASQTRHVGAICLDTRPLLILMEAFQQAQYLCRREFNRAPQLMVNGVPAKEYILADARIPEDQFPYVDLHLYFVFFQVVKNAILASIQKAGPDGEPEPVHASLISGTSLCSENERTMKISDTGQGISRDDVRRVFSYFHSTVAEGAAGRACAAPQLPLVARGLTLAVSRVLVRYFGGEIDVHSIPRKGTDVYIYL